MVTFKIVIKNGVVRVYYAMMDITSRIGISGRVRDIKRLPGEVSRRKLVYAGKTEYTILANYYTLLAHKSKLESYIVR